jgi:hypothetical protein
MFESGLTLGLGIIVVVCGSQASSSSSFDLSWWVAFMRASRGLWTDDSVLKASQMLERVLAEEAKHPSDAAMEVEGKGESRALAGLWARYQLAREAILNGFYGPACR